MSYIQIYKDKADEWRWSFRGDNNEIMADSSEGYQNKMDMYRSLQHVCGGFMTLGEIASEEVLTRENDSIPVRFRT